MTVAPPFRIVGPLGEGGMAEVLLAEDSRGTRFALKRPRTEHASDSRVARMLDDEARIGAAIDDARVVRVIGAARPDEAARWLALELVDGMDLGRWRELADERGVEMSETVGIAIAIEVARGLHAAHSAVDADGEPLGVVHRDVSPSNVLVARDGAVKIGDFGVARASGRLGATTAGIVKGTHAYMAPEQLLGGAVDRRADVFGLGCTLHAALTGASPLAVEGAAATLVGGHEIELDARLSEDVRSVIARAVSSTRARRWPSASAMADALSEVLVARTDDGRAVIAEWVAKIEAAGQTEALPGAPWPRRSRAAVIVVAAVAVAAVAAVVFVAAPGSPPSAPRDAAADLPPVAVGAAAPVPTGASPAPSVANEAASVDDVLRPAPRRRATTEARAAEPADVREGLVPASGFVVVGGAGANRARVWIDGREIDFAPATVELPVGEHRVELRREDGSVIGARSIDVHPEHTRRAPARWIVAE